MAFLCQWTFLWHFLCGIQTYTIDRYCIKSRVHLNKKYFNKNMLVIKTALYRTFYLLNVCVKATITKAQRVIYLHKARIDTINSIKFCLFDKNKLSCWQNKNVLYIFIVPFWTLCIHYITWDVIECRPTGKTTGCLYINWHVVSLVRETMMI
jgi:hypothetical protein